MKIVILLLMLFLMGTQAYSADATKAAPLKGKLLEKETVLKYIRMDGSELTKFNESFDWYLTKPASGTNKFEVPNFVKTVKPVKIIYKTMNGNEFATYDLRNWVKHSENQDVKPISITNPNILEVTKLPKEPVVSDFSIEFVLRTNVEVTLSIYDIQGKVVYQTKTQMKSGFNQFNVPVEKYQSGSYTYRIFTGVAIYNGVFIKL